MTEMGTDTVVCADALEWLAATLDEIRRGASDNEP